MTHTFYAILKKKKSAALFKEGQFNNDDLTRSAVLVDGEMRHVAEHCLLFTWIFRVV